MTEISKEELLNKKSELETRLQKIKSDIAGGLDADFAEQAVQLENRDVLLEIMRVTEEELQKINAKLQGSE
jgi:RNA polymerase-binding transcription factor DksA